MEFTHEEMLMKIKEGRDLAKNAMELADGMRTEAEKDLYCAGASLVATINEFIWESIEDKSKAESLLMAVTDILTDKIMPLSLASLVSMI